MYRLFFLMFHHLPIYQNSNDIHSMVDNIVEYIPIDNPYAIGIKFHLTLGVDHVFAYNPLYSDLKTDRLFAPTPDLIDHFRDTFHSCFLFSFYIYVSVCMFFPQGDASTLFFVFFIFSDTS